MHKIILGVSLVGLLATVPAQAQQCRTNFNIRGEVYTSSQVVPGVAPAAALPRIAAALQSKGYFAIRVNQGAKTVTALQDGAGNGRTQTMTIAARPVQQGSRIEMRFVVAPGQLAPAEPGIQEFCSIVAAVR